jgi:hypothetical protein
MPRKLTTSDGAAKGLNTKNNNFGGIIIAGLFKSSSKAESYLS